MSVHSESAKELFAKGYNCSQSVVLAFCDETGLDPETALKISSSFGGGMGRLREVCGAVTGMFIVLGLLYGYSDPLDRAAKTEHYELIQSVAMRFKEKNKSLICRDLLGLTVEKDSPVPAERTEAYYNERPCLNLVGFAAELLDEYINHKKTGGKNDENRGSV